MMVWWSSVVDKPIQLCILLISMISFDAWTHEQRWLLSLYLNIPFLTMLVIMLFRDKSLSLQVSPPLELPFVIVTENHKSIDRRWDVRYYVYRRRRLPANSSRAVIRNWQWYVQWSAIACSAFSIIKLQWQSLLMFAISLEWRPILYNVFLHTVIVRTDVRTYQVMTCFSMSQATCCAWHCS